LETAATQVPTHLSLFTGIGGLDIAAERAGFQTIGQCEWADYPTRVLEKHWPDVARWRDIRTLTQESFYDRTGLRTADVISGGFPCQPFSNAGKRRGAEDDRYIWPEMLRVIQELRPTWVVGENVAGIVSMALDTVLSDLEGQGYQTRAFIIPACGVDAPHRRDRVAIVAYTQRAKRREGKPAGYEPDGENAGREEEAGRIGASSPHGRTWTMADTNCKREPQQAREQPKGRHGTGDGSRTISYTNSAGREGTKPKQTAGRPGFTNGGRYVPDTAGAGLLPAAQPGIHSPEEGGGARDVEPERFGWWPVEPDVGRVANGIPHRVDRLRCLGNAVVPAQFYPIFQAIYDISYREAQHG